MQTDAKISPANYGGPVVDLREPDHRRPGAGVAAARMRRPASRWYDSGIGFAVPRWKTLNASLPRLLKGTEKVPVVLKLAPACSASRPRARISSAPPPPSARSAPGSAAEKFGIKANDIIIAVDDKPVANLAQLLTQRSGSKYEGDSVKVKLKRGEQEVELKEVVLSSAVASYGQPFLGILPMRDDTTPGIEVRYVYPKSPADVAGIKVGDRLEKVGLVQAGQPVQMQPITNRDQLLARLDTAAPGIDLKFEVKRKAGGKVETVDVKLGELPNTVPDELPETASIQDRKPEKEGRQKG